MPDIHGGPRVRRTALSLAMLGLLLLSSGAVPGGTAANDTAELLHVADWRDGGHQGADLTVDISADGSRLLLVGYAAPDDVRVTDRDLVPVAVLEPGPGPFDVKGAAWSATDGSALVWGRAAGGDRDVILAYEAPTYALNGSYGASDYGGLVRWTRSARSSWTSSWPWRGGTRTGPAWSTSSRRPAWRSSFRRSTR